MPVVTLSVAIKAGYALSLLGSAGLAKGLKGIGPVYSVILNRLWAHSKGSPRAGEEKVPVVTFSAATISRLCLLLNSAERACQQS